MFGVDWCSRRSCSTLFTASDLEDFHVSHPAALSLWLINHTSITTRILAIRESRFTTVKCIRQVPGVQVLLCSRQGDR